VTSALAVKIDAPAIVDVTVNVATPEPFVVADSS